MTETKPNQTNIKREKQRGPKVPKRITETYLHNSGLYYLERYSTSSHNFRQVMLRKVRKSCFHHQDQNYDDCTKLVDALVDKFLRSGLLNDQLYLDGMVHSYRRRGLSTRMIHQKLGQKGLSENDIQRTLHQCDQDMLNAEQQHDAELIAAVRFCRSKKLGAYTSITKAVDDNLSSKQLAKMARAGFPYEIARQALDLTQAEIEELS
jgi:regulatory protein